MPSVFYSCNEVSYKDCAKGRKKGANSLILDQVSESSGEIKKYKCQDSTVIHLNLVGLGWGH